ncbi:MAG: hypothetical protein IK081_13280 [Lachnospiraceae bacterium]|nr:hypothetical protein [Lachnospiraceae bacterium]
MEALSKAATWFQTALGIPVSEGFLFLEIFLSCFIFIIVGGLCLVKRDGNKRLKDLKAKTIGDVIEASINKEYNAMWRNYDSPSEKTLMKQTVKYDFFVNGVCYGGSGEIPSLSFSKKVKIRYNPKDPKQNCTAYSYKWDSGNGLLMAMLIIWGILVLGPFVIGMLV